MARAAVIAKQECWRIAKLDSFIASECGWFNVLHAAGVN